MRAKGREREREREALLHVERMDLANHYSKVQPYETDNTKDFPAKGKENEIVHKLISKCSLTTFCSIILLMSCT